MDTLRWIHLSDIHFSGDESYEIKRMRDSLVEKLKEISQEQKFDMVIITGDLTYQGGAYDSKLKTFIESLQNVLNVSKDDLFFIPGNHDLKRTQVRTLAIEGIKRDGFKFEKDTIDQLKKDFKKYNMFYKQVKNESVDYIYKLVKRDGYNIFLMNTAFTAGTDKDEGNLTLEKDSFYEEIKQLKDQEASINIAIGHHPIACFSENDQAKIWNMFNDFNIDFYLCGHLHRGAYDYDLSGSRLIPTYQCGSGRVDDYATVTFSIGELNVSKRRGKVVSYKWLTNEECWTIGGIDGRRAISGEMDITLDRFSNISSSSLVDDVDVDEDEFRRFMMKFHEQLKQGGVEEVNIDPKDVFEKFSNMKCNKSVERQYHSLCRYFPVIVEVMESALLTQIERESIPNIVISEYNKILGKAANGNEILEEIVENIFVMYHNKFQYSNTTLKTYFKILVYWSIYECDIFNDRL